jgi:hypothetical protein
LDHDPAAARMVQADELEALEAIYAEVQCAAPP